MDIKKCKRCEEIKPLDHYHHITKRNTLKSGEIREYLQIFNVCKTCSNLQRNLLRKGIKQVNPERNNNFAVIDGMREIYLSMGYKNIDEYRKERSLKELKQMYYESTRQKSL